MNAHSPPTVHTDWRQYQAIWESLKARRECVVTAHPSLHKRIIKAVIKEKYNDVGWKVQIEHACIPWNKIQYTREHSLIRFKLKMGIGLGTL